MTKSAALYAFFNNAIPGFSAYLETAVPSRAAGDDHDAALPYLTYTNPISTFDAGEVPVTVNLWARSTGEKTLNDAVETLSGAIGRGGITLSCDGGYIWLKRGSPFAQSIQDPDPKIKRRYINITAEYLTAD